MGPTVYALVNAKQKKHYFGFTSKTAQIRLAQHNGLAPGGAAPTRLGRPWALAARVTGFNSKPEALAFENACQHPSAPPGTMLRMRRYKGLMPYRRMFAAVRALGLRRGKIPARSWAERVLQGVLTLQMWQHLQVQYYAPQAAAPVPLALPAAPHGAAQVPAAFAPGAPAAAHAAALAAPKVLVVSAAPENADLIDLTGSDTEVESILCL